MATYGLFRILDAGWVEDEANFFTDDRGVRVPGQAIRLGEFALGSDIEIPVRGGQDMAVTAGLSVVLTREERWGEGAVRTTADSDTRGRMNLGLEYGLSGGASLEFSAVYDGIGASDSEDSYIFSFGLTDEF